MRYEEIKTNMTVAWGLKNAVSQSGEQSDHAVCIDFTASSPMFAAVPATLDAREFLDPPTDQSPNPNYNAPAFNTAGFDVYSVSDITFHTSFTPAGLCYFFPNGIARIFLRSGGAVVFLHEIGHATGLNLSSDPNIDNHHPYVKNLMYYSPEHYYLEEEQGYKLKNGIPQWVKTQW